MLGKKQNKISIAFAVKSNKKIGAGHLERCRALAKKFQQMIECNIRFFPRISLNKISNFDICIVDLLDIKEKQIKQLKKQNKLLIRIDNNRDCIILKKEFEKLAKKTKPILKNPKQIFVCFGGSDANNLTERLIKSLKQINLDKRIKINVILGPLFGKSKKIQNLIKFDKRYVLHKNISNLANLLWQSDLAIISGGTLMYEACLLGIPSIVICQNQEQNREAGFFEKKRAVINLGVYNKLDNKKTGNTILFLLNNLNLRKQMSKTGKKLINPDGAERIVKIVLKTL